MKSRAGWSCTRLATRIAKSHQPLLYLDQSLRDRILLSGISSERPTCLECGQHTGPFGKDLQESAILRR